MTVASKNNRVAGLAVLGGLAMLSLSYAAVPLYKLFCQQTGFGGTTQRAEVAPVAATEKFITVRFDANTAPSLPWHFAAKQQIMKIKIGEQAMAYYEAENLSSKVITGTAAFNVTPPQAGIYFNKLQCFCFTEQTLKPGEKVDMPVAYFVDPAILDDLDAKSISEITLSYTFYSVENPAAKSAGLKTN